MLDVDRRRHATDGATNMTMLDTKGHASHTTVAPRTIHRISSKNVAVVPFLGSSFCGEGGQPAQRRAFRRGRRRRGGPQVVHGLHHILFDIERKEKEKKTKRAERRGRFEEEQSWS